MKRLWLPVAVGMLAAAGCSSDSAAPSSNPTDDGDVALSPQVIAQMDALIAEKQARTSAQRKISSSLLYTKSNKFAASADSKDPKKKLVSLAQTDDAGRYLVDVRGDMSALGGKIEALGGKVTNARVLRRRRHRHQGRRPVGQR